MNPRRSFLRTMTGAMTLAGVAVMPGAALAQATTADTRSAGQKLDDQTIETKVKAALIAKDEVRAGKIQVEVRDGIAYLSGTVGSAAEAQEALGTAQGVDGVKSVKSTLVVSTQR